MYYLIWRFLPLDSCSSSGDGCGSRFLSLSLDRPNPTRLHLSLSACVRLPMCRRLLCELTSSQNEPTTRATTKPREPKTAFISEARLACYFAWRAVVWRVIWHPRRGIDVSTPCRLQRCSTRSPSTFVTQTRHSPPVAAVACPI